MGTLGPHAADLNCGADEPRSKAARRIEWARPTCPQGAARPGDLQGPRPAGPVYGVAGAFVVGGGHRSLSGGSRLEPTHTPGGQVA